MTNTLIKTGLGIALTTVISLTAFADDSMSSTTATGQSMSQPNNANTDAGRMSAGGGVQPADQYGDGYCQGDNCPDENLQEDNAATDIPDDNTDESNDSN